MMAYCQGHQTLSYQGTAFVKTIKELMQLLLEYRAVVNDSDNRDCMMCCTVNLLASFCISCTLAVLGRQMLFCKVPAGLESQEKSGN